MSEPAATLAIAESDVVQLKQLLPTLPQHVRGLPDAVATAIVARELGLLPMTAFPDLMIVNGTVGMTSKLMLALVYRAGHLLIVEEQSSERATVVAKRRYDNEWVTIGTFTFTMEDAEKAKLANKETYKLYPSDMLLNKAIARATRFAFPDVLRGYVPDEMEEITGVEMPVAMHLGTLLENMPVEEVTEALDAEMVDEYTE